MSSYICENLIIPTGTTYPNFFKKYDIIKDKNEDDITTYIIKSKTPQNYYGFSYFLSQKTYKQWVVVHYKRSNLFLIQNEKVKKIFLDEKLISEDSVISLDKYDSKFDEELLSLFYTLSRYGTEYDSKKLWKELISYPNIKTIIKNTTDEELKNVFIQEYKFEPDKYINSENKDEGDWNKKQSLAGFICIDRKRVENVELADLYKDNTLLHVKKDINGRAGIADVMNQIQLSVALEHEHKDRFFEKLHILGCNTNKISRFVLVAILEKSKHENSITEILEKWNIKTSLKILKSFVENYKSCGKEFRIQIVERVD